MSDAALRDRERALPEPLSLADAVAVAHHWDRAGLPYPPSIEAHRRAALLALRRCFCSRQLEALVVMAHIETILHETAGRIASQELDLIIWDSMAPTTPPGG